MAVVTFHNEHRSIEVDSGTNLRQLMRKVGVTPYSGLDILTNCRGHNFCGTCAVTIDGNKGASPRGQDEEATIRGNLLVAKVVEKDARLACQTTVTGDMVVRTHPVMVTDKQQTRQRVTLLGISTFFALTFLAMFGILFFDMIKKFRIF
jgi:ferredoxin